LAVAVPLPASGGELVHKTFSAKSHSGSRDRQYQVFVPSAYNARDPVPLVMVLHGCKQTEQNMINETRFKELAERENFIVVYPFITSYDGSRSPNCWGFWFDQHIHEGAGEVEDLHLLAREVEAQYKIDPERRYVTGLSSGAAMSVVLAVAQSEYFAAAGAAAGLPYSETSSAVGFVCANPGRFKPVSDVVTAMRNEQRTTAERRVIPMMTIHSSNDCTVNKQASENIRDSWLQRYGSRGAPFATVDCTKEGVSCTHQKYGSARRSVVETVFYAGARGDLSGSGAHYWVGDNAGEFANPNGPSATELFWDFFKRHTFSDNQPPTIAIASSTATGTSIAVKGTAADSDGTIAEVVVQLDGQQPPAAKKATGTASWSVTFDNVVDNAIYVPIARATDSKGATTSATGPPVTVGRPPPNQAPAVSLDPPSIDGTCITLTGTASDADGAVATVAAELGNRGFKPTSLSNGRYRYQECGLPGGVYSTRARATDNLGAQRLVAGKNVTVPELEVVMANWLDHMNASRLRTYGEPCVVGFGACDAGFQTIFQTHSFNPFPLYRAPHTSAWFLDPANIRANPEPPRADASGRRPKAGKEAAAQ
jgi:poly(hydroxyalkanoate) depolymerase family esterase